MVIILSDDLQNFNNLYANLAQGSYPKAQVKFPIENVLPSDRQALNSGKSVKYNFSDDVPTKNGTIPGGQNLPNNGVIYLQPDPTLKTVPIRTSITTPNPNGGYTTTNPITSTTQKGLLTDDPSGFNAYFLTDTPTLNKKTQQTYLAIRGSDGEIKFTDTSNWDDWLGNNYIFAMGARHVPQAKVATPAISAVLSKIRSSGSSAPLNLTGHSLGTFVTVQGVAGLKNDEIDQIGKLVLFNGPDPTDSLKKMGLSDAKIAKLSSKTTYYINPFDMVSSLNRTKPFDQQFGRVKVIVPLHYSTSFDSPNAHMFGVYQINANGEPLVASANFHPELLTASHKLAVLNHKAIAKLKNLGFSDDLIASFFNGDISIRVGAASTIWLEYIKEYQDIITETRAASIKWNLENIPKYAARIRSASGAERIRLRADLLQLSAQQAIFEMESHMKNLKDTLSNAKDEVRLIFSQTEHEVLSMCRYLNVSEASALLSEIRVSRAWDDGVEAETLTAARNFSNDISNFSYGLVEAAAQLEAVDQQEASLINSLIGGS